VTVGKGVNNVGLLRDQSRLKRPGEPDAEQVAAGYVKHLEGHPLDSHVRERLAVLYAGHYQRMDLATEQLEQLIQQPKQPAKQVVKWLETTRGFAGSERRGDGSDPRDFAADHRSVSGRSLGRDHAATAGYFEPRTQGQTK